MIEIHNLTKQYAKVKAVDGLNLTIEKGEFFGLLGPNGAGKTTLIRMISTLTPETEGQIKLDKVLVSRDEISAKAKIGVVPQHINLEWELTPTQNLLLHGKLFGMEKNKLQSRVEELLHYTDLYERRNDKVKQFSGGMKRKLMIARALLHEPKVLLLDEPTVGLDAAVRRKLWDLMKGLNQNGMTVLLTTHYIEEAEALCNRVGFIESGKIAELGTPRELIQKVGEVAVDCFSERETKTYFFQNKEEALKKAAECSGNHVSVNIRPSNLEDTFIMLTNRKVGD